MAKVSREDLKNIVKECLVEILREGIGSTVTKCTSMPVQRQQPTQQRQINSQLETTIKNVTRGDDVMAEILADTAKTTLPRMINEDKGDIDKVEQFSGTPETVFGEENVSTWAALAFADKTFAGKGAKLLEQND